MKLQRTIIYSPNTDAVNDLVLDIFDCVDTHIEGDDTSIHLYNWANVDTPLDELLMALDMEGIEWNGLDEEVVEVEFGSLAYDFFMECEEP